jgi:rare lipoprotein A
MVLMATGLSACASRTTTGGLPGLDPSESRPGAIQEGIASWYGPDFHGKRTTSGEVYDQDDLTAAHPSLPLGTRVAVTHLENGRSVEVRVNDRGPFAKSRVIDLSRAAADVLDMIGTGTAPVRLQVLGAPQVGFAPLLYTVQVGSFADPKNADNLQSRLQDRFGDVYVTRLDAGSSSYYRVRVGRFRERTKAVGLAREMGSLGLRPVVMEAGNAH